LVFIQFYLRLYLTLTKQISKVTGYEQKTEIRFHTRGKFFLICQRIQTASQLTQLSDRRVPGASHPEGKANHSSVESKCTGRFSSNV
jgi:hypothetical protein